jgi:hypothetical protein
MKERVSIVLLLTFALPVVGCYSLAVPYTPNRPPVPLITHKGEVNISGGTHFPLAPGWDYQIVYAPWEHYSVFGAVQFDEGYEEDGLAGPDTSDYNNQFYEIGVGYFDSIRWAQYEAYFHAGFGSGLDHKYLKIWPGYTAKTDTTSLLTYRFGIQQNIGTESDYAAFGIGLGVGYEKFYQVNRTSTEYDWRDSDSLTSSPTIIERDASYSNFYAQPVIFWRFGYKSIKVIQEFWFRWNTNTSSLFRTGNESLTLQIVF